MYLCQLLMLFIVYETVIIVIFTTMLVYNTIVLYKYRHGAFVNFHYYI